MLFEQNNLSPSAPDILLTHFEVDPWLIFQTLELFSMTELIRLFGINKIICTRNFWRHYDAYASAHHIPSRYKRLPDQYEKHPPISVLIDSIPEKKCRIKGCGLKFDKESNVLEFIKHVLDVHEAELSQNVEVVTINSIIKAYFDTTIYKRECLKKGAVWDESVFVYTRKGIVTPTNSRHKQFLKQYDKQRNRVRKEIKAQGLKIRKKHRLMIKHARYSEEKADLSLFSAREQLFIMKVAEERRVKADIKRLRISKNHPEGLIERQDMSLEITGSFVEDLDG